jgi:hypothetical protein
MDSEPPKACDQSFVFRIYRTKIKRLNALQPWAGVVSSWHPPVVTWQQGIVTPYNVDVDPAHSIEHLVADLAAGALVVSAIRCNERLTSVDPHLDDCLAHVFAAVHQQSSPQFDWLAWIVQRLHSQHPLSSRGRPKLPHRGVAKPKPKCRCILAEFTKQLPLHLTRKDTRLLYREHVALYH